MDIEMPGLSGIEVTRHITEKFPGIKILIQTVFNDTDKIFQALCAGASGYILKNDPRINTSKPSMKCIMAAHRKRLCCKKTAWFFQ
jgi:DNA-binding NarL/FixJ family response regulator